MKEMWKPIGFLGDEYLVSNTGKVKSCDRKIADCNGRLVTYKGKLYEQKINSRGYYRVFILGKRYFVHRLVALAFCENPNKERYTIVNHIDNNPLNNNAENLEWTDPKGNVHHAMKQGRMDRTEAWLRHLRETNEKNGKTVARVNPITNTVEKTYVCLRDVRHDGFQPSSVCLCCQGKLSMHHGFRWEYATR